MGLSYKGSIALPKGGMKIKNIIGNLIISNPTVWDSTYLYTATNTVKYTLSENNTRAISSVGTYSNVTSEFSASSGKYYFEYTLMNATVSNYIDGVLGVTNKNPSSTEPEYIFVRWGIYPDNDGSASVQGKLINNDVWLDGYCDPVLIGDVVGIAIDLDNKVGYLSVNGVWQYGCNPNTNQNPVFTNLNGDIFASVMDGSGSYFNDVKANFGQEDMVYPIPTGYKIGFGE